MLFAAVLVHPAACGAAQATPDPRAVAAGVSHDLRVQDRLPSEDGAWSGGDTRTDGGGGYGGPSAGSGGSQNASADWGPILIALGVFAVVCVLVVAGSWLSDAFGGRAGRGAREDERGESAARPAAAREVLATADELAAAGRYTEAMHQLLADALAALRRRIAGEISDSLTSREILRALTLGPPQHDALHDMIARVEQTWFAKRTAALADYDAVRASFQIFTGAGAAR